MAEARVKVKREERKGNVEGDGGNGGGGGCDVGVHCVDSNGGVDDDDYELH